VYTIGEFSKITGLTVKTLRVYHEQHVLLPSHVDEETGYRYYAEAKVDEARIVARLRELDFSLADIGEILKSYDDEADILEFLQRQKQTVQGKLRQYREIEKSLESIITKEREARTAMQATTFQIEEKQIETMLIAGIRMRGQYSECGRGFSQVCRTFGRHACGKPFLLQYDREYKEDDAEFEACVPIRKGTSVDGISVRELAGGRCVTLLHQGPYQELTRSYEKILSYAKSHGYQVQIPTREVYLKGPGMIFRGNPKKYLTEIQMLIDGASSSAG
jgi:DNA-binding transcriptional MerR regulator/effector-binding domain-containing protein